MNHQSRFDAGYRKLGAGALGWPRGMVWGGKWEGGFRIGNTCTPMADACWCMAKPIKYCKVKKKKRKKKRQRNQSSNFQHSLDHQKGKRIPEKHLFLLYWLCQSFWLCGSQQIVVDSLNRWEYQTILPAFWKICMQVRKQQLELDMEQQTGSK